MEKAELEELIKLSNEVEKARRNMEETILKCRKEAEELIPQLQSKIQELDSKITVLQNEREEAVVQLKLISGFSVMHKTEDENVLPVIVTPAMYAKVVDDVAENCQYMETDDLTDEAKGELLGIFKGKTFKVVGAKITGSNSIDLTVEEVK